MNITDEHYSIVASEMNKELKDTLHTQFITATRIHYNSVSFNEHIIIAGLCYNYYTHFKYLNRKDLKFSKIRNILGSTAYSEFDEIPYHSRNIIILKLTAANTFFSDTLYDIENGFYDE